VSTFGGARHDARRALIWIQMKKIKNKKRIPNSGVFLKTIPERACSWLSCSRMM
jgi:hypothetical protein